MKRKLMALASAAMIALATGVTPNKAEAHWHGGWWVPGAVIGGIALGAALASRPYYYYDYGPYYYGGPYYYYYGGGPYYYGYPYWHHRHYGYRYHRHYGYRYHRHH